MCARTKVVVIDDDEKALKNIHEMLADYPDLSITGMASNAQQGLELVEEIHPDVLFLDIELPDMNGLELLDNIKRNHKNTYVVIFTGKYDNYQNEVFAHNENDYLLKPVLPQELDKVVRRYRHYVYSHRAAQPAPNNQKSDMLAITTITNEMRVVRVSEIGYFRYSTQRKIWEVALNDNSFLTLHKGTSAVTILGYSNQFVQTHQSYIVNVNSVMLIGQNNVILYPPFNDNVVQLGRTFKKKLQEMFIMI